MQKFFYKWIHTKCSINLKCNLLNIGVNFQNFIPFKIFATAPRFVIMYGFLIILLCSFIVMLLPINKLSIIFFVASLTIAEILVFPTSSVLVAEITPDKYRGTAFGAIDLEYLGSAIGPALGGVIIQYFAIFGFFIGIFLVSCLCTLAYWPCLKPSLHNVEEYARKL